MLVKNVLLLIGLSVAAIFFQDQLMQLLQLLTHIHNVIARGLGVIFSVDSVGEVVQSVLALLLIPVLLGIIISFAHFFVKQVHFPHTLLVIWISWAVLLASVLTQTGYVTNHPTACHGSGKFAAHSPNGVNAVAPNGQHAQNIPQNNIQQNNMPQNMSSLPQQHGA